MDLVVGEAGRTRIAVRMGVDLAGQETLVRDLSRSGTATSNVTAGLSIDSTTFMLLFLFLFLLFFLPFFLIIILEEVGFQFLELLGHLLKERHGGRVSERMSR